MALDALNSLLRTATLGLDCDSPGVAEIVSEMAAIVVSTGGYVSDQLTIRERQGDVTAHAPRVEQVSGKREKLIALSDLAMPEVNLAEWSWHGSALSVVPDPTQEASGNRLLELHAELLTATGKPRWFLTEHPRATIAAGSSTLRAIHELRPRFELDATPGGLLDTRTLGKGKDQVKSLIPLAELLNHHPNGSPFVADNGQVVVRQHQPNGGTECFTNYGGFRRDPLDLALHYGYADSAVRVAMSAPLQLKAAGFGDIHIRALKPQAKSRIDPPTVTRGSDGLSLSHLTLQADRPGRLVVPLTMIAETLGASAPERAARELLGTVIERNLELLEVLVRSLDRGTPMGAMLTEACGYQTRILRSVGADVA